MTNPRDIDKNWARVDTSINDLNEFVQWLHHNVDSRYFIYLHHVSFENPKEATHFSLAFKGQQ